MPIAEAVAIAAGDVALVVLSWKRRSVLSGVLGAAGMPLLAIAMLLIAALALAVGVAVFGIGQVLQRLLDDETVE